MQHCNNPKSEIQIHASAGGAALGGAAGWPALSKPPSPLQFWHLPLPCGKQEVHCFPF
jgi:hypothetical protein